MASEMPKFVLELHPNDVLLGRGKPAIQNEGNIRFRRIVQSRKNEYVQNIMRHRKDSIARQILDEIIEKKGLFLRRIESSVEAERLGLPKKVVAWTPVNNEVAILKIKQALRTLPASTSSSLNVNPANTKSDDSTVRETAVISTDCHAKEISNSMDERLVKRKRFVGGNIWDLRPKMEDTDLPQQPPLTLDYGVFGCNIPGEEGLCAFHHRHSPPLNPVAAFDKGDSSYNVFCMSQDPLEQTLERPSSPSLCIFTTDGFVAIEQDLTSNNADDECSIGGPHYDVVTLEEHNRLTAKKRARDCDQVVKNESMTATDPFNRSPSVVRPNKRSRLTELGTRTIQDTTNTMVAPPMACHLMDTSLGSSCDEHVTALDEIDPVLLCRMTECPTDLPVIGNGLSMYDYYFG